MITKIALLKNFPIRNDYKASLYFSSFSEKVSYFQRNFSLSLPVTAQDFDPSTQFTQVNLPMGTTLRTGIEIGFKPEEINKYNIQRDYMGLCNYLVAVRQPDEDDPDRLDMYFYFITDVKQTTKNTWFLALEEDVMTTCTPLTFRDKVFVERKHCSRFKLTSGKYDVYSQDALLGDPIDEVFKASVFGQPTRRDIVFDNANTAFSTGFNKIMTNTLWAYVFLSSNTLADTTTYKSYEPLNISTFKVLSKSGASQTIDTGLYCLAFPISDKVYFKAPTDQENPGQSDTIMKANWAKAVNFIKEQPNNVSIKISNISPIDVSRDYVSYLGYGTTYVSGTDEQVKFGLQYLYMGESLGGDEDFNYLNTSQQLDVNSRCVALNISCKTVAGTPIYRNAHFLAFGCNFYDYSRPYKSSDIKTSNAKQLTTLPLNTALKDKMYEPKLYTSPYHFLGIKALYSNAHLYNEMLLGLLPVNLTIVDVPNPIETKYFIRLQPTDTTSPYYYFKEQYSGLVGMNVYEANTFNSAYTDYISSHANYVLTGLAIPIAESVGTTALSVATGNYGLAVVTAVSGVTSAIKFTARMDDLKKTPLSVKLAGNDLLQDIARNDDMIYQTFSFDLLDREQDQVFDYYFENGYQINRDCVWAKGSASTPDGVLNRSRFNYVKLNDDRLYSKLTNIDLSSEVKTKICDILNSGVTLWNTGTTIDPMMFSYTYENMEYYIN